VTRRRAVTLVELALFAGIGMMVIAMAWSFLSTSLRQGARTDNKLDGVQADLLLAVQLERDLEACVVHPDVPPPAIDLTDGGAQLRIHRATQTGARERWDPLEVTPVVYQFLVETGRVVRQVGNQAPRALWGHFERVSFRLAPNGEEPGIPGALPEAPAIVYSAAGVPRTLLERPLAEREGPDRTVIVGGVALTQAARRKAYPFWNRVPYGMTPQGAEVVIVGE
jgi:hypothetical protein